MVKYYYINKATLLLWLLLSSYTYAQTPIIDWQISYGGPGNDAGTIIHDLNNSTFLVGGYLNQGPGGTVSCVNQDDDNLFLKYDIDGNLIWDNCQIGNDSDRMQQIAVLDNYYYTISTSFSGIGFDKTTAKKYSWIVITDDSGSIMSDFGYEPGGGTASHGIFSTSLDELIITGTASGSLGPDRSVSDCFLSTSESDIWVVKSDKNGNKIWDNIYGGFYNESIYNKTVNQVTGGYFIGGISRSSPSCNKTAPHYGGQDGWLFKIDEDGNMLWDKSYGGSGDDFIRIVIPATGGGYLMVCSSTSGVTGNKTTPGYGGTDIWLIKIDDVGNKEWEKTYGGSGNDEGFDIIPSIEGGYLIFGNSTSGISGTKTTPNKGNQDYWLIKITEDGIQEWDVSFGGNVLDAGRGIIELAPKEYILVGSSNSPVSGDRTAPHYGAVDVWIIRTKPDVPLSLPAPRLQAALAGGTSARLQWQAPPPLTSPVIERAEQASALQWRSVATLGADTAGVWLDENLRPGMVYYYRLRASGRYSPLVRIETPPGPQFSLAPNPARNNTTLRYDWSAVSGAEKGELLLTDALGRQVRQLPASTPAGELAVPLDGLAAGCYGVAFQVGGVVWRGGMLVVL